MPRKGPVTKRKRTPDPVYHSELVSRFVDNIMKMGKKSLAERIFYSAMDEIALKTKKDPMVVFNKALDNVMPMVEVRPRRVGGATYQVPMEVRPDRKVALGIRWILKNARKKPGRTMRDKLSSELMDAYQGIGASVKKREDTHKMAEANKAFAHYRW
ncbi:MAG: 30S ribosomal protein S7 [Candidatus Eremiobacteraeota bacterium]|nr:30S ribosomal protein S7 [Candidatus Eremiobacteraeota bacterium]